MSHPVPKRPARWWQYVRAGRIFCPVGHHIPNTFDVTEAGYVRCNHWVDADRAECGLWIFLFNVRGGGVVTVAVSLEEKAAMTYLTTPAELIEYLGIFHR